MKKVFMLWHVHPPDTEEHENIVGIYSTQAHAEAAADRLKNTPAFANCKEGFQIHSHELNKDGWTEGYVIVS
jgi:hypothetical protein